MGLLSDRWKLFFQQPIQTHVETPDHPTDPGFPDHGDILVYSTAVGKYIAVTPPIAQGQYPLAVEGSMLVWDAVLDVFVVSTTPWLDPAFGDISVKDAAVTQAVTATPAKLDAFDADGTFSLTVVDHTDDSIVVDEAGVYEAEFVVSYGYGAAAVVQFYIRVDTVETQFGMKQENLAPGDVMNGVAKARLDLAAGETVTVYVEADADSNITVSDAVLTLKRIAGS